MKKIFFCLIAFISFNALNAADVNKSAAITPNLKLPEQGTKIGFVDPYKVLQGLEQWKDEGMRIQKELQSRNDIIEAKKTAYGKKAQEVQSMGTTAKPEVKTARMEELKQLEVEINIKSQSLQEYAERVAQEAQMAVFKEIEAAAHEVALEMGLDIVLAGGVLYVSEKLDISANLITKMNTKYVAKKKQDQKTAAAKTIAK